MIHQRYPRLVALGLTLALLVALLAFFARAASAQESDWIVRRLRALCAPFGTEVGFSDGLIDVRPRG